MGHRLVLVPTKARRTPAVLVAVQVNGGSWGIMPEADAMRLVNDNQGCNVLVQSLSINCATCGDMFGPDINTRRDHSGQFYCSESCWETAWQS